MDVPLLALTRQPARLPGHSPQEAVIENLRLLVQLRWIAVLGQLLAIVVAHFLLEVQLPLTPMLGIVALLAVGNCLFTLTLNQGWLVRGELLLALFLDMTALTAQLYLSGGVENPFISLYLLQVVLGAILLPAVLAWLLVGLSVAAFIFLALFHLPLKLPSINPGGFDLRVLGEESAFIMVAVLLVLFTTRITRNYRAHDAQQGESKSPDASTTVVKPTSKRLPPRVRASGC